MIVHGRIIQVQARMESITLLGDHLEIVVNCWANLMTYTQFSKLREETNGLSLFSDSCFRMGEMLKA